MKTLQDLTIALESITVYRFEEGVPSSFSLFQTLVEQLSDSLPVVMRNWNLFYGFLVKESLHASLPDSLFAYILQHSNPFSVSCANGKFVDTTSHLRVAVKRDLDQLYAFGQIKPSLLKQALKELHPDYEKEITALPEWEATHQIYQFITPWGDGVAKLVDFYHQNGYGVFALGNFYKTGPEFEVTRVLLSKQPVVEEQTAAAIHKFVEEIVQGNAKNTVFAGRHEHFLAALQPLLQQDQYARVKVLKITVKDLSRFDTLVDLLHRTPCHFLLVLDDITYMMKNHSHRFIVATGQEGLHYNRTNISLVALVPEVMKPLPALFEQQIRLWDERENVYL